MYPIHPSPGRFRKTFGTPNVATAVQLSALPRFHACMSGRTIHLKLPGLSNDNYRDLLITKLQTSPYKYVGFFHLTTRAALCLRVAWEIGPARPGN